MARCPLRHGRASDYLPQTDEAWVKDELAEMVDELTPSRASWDASTSSNSSTKLSMAAPAMSGSAASSKTGSWREVVEETCRELRTFRPL